MKKKYLLLVSLIAVFAYLGEKNNIYYHAKNMLLGPSETSGQSYYYTGELKFSDPEIIESNYWGSTIAFTYFQPTKKKYEKLGITLEEGLSLPKKHWVFLSKTAKEGRRVTVYIPRTIYPKSGFSTNVIDFEVWDMDGREVLNSVARYEVRIDWPSLSSAENDHKKNGHGFEVLKSVTISERVPHRVELINWLVEKGMSPDDISVKNVIGSGQNVHLVLNDRIPVADLRPLTTKLMAFDSAIEFFDVGDEAISGHLEIGTGLSTGDSISNTTLDRLATEELSTEEFYRIAGIPWLDKEEKAEQLVAKAKTLLDTGQRMELAKGYIDEAMNLDPNQPKAYVELARYLMKTREDFSERAPSATGKYVSDVLLKALEIAPDNIDVMVLLGYVFTVQERFDDAEALHRKIASLGTDNWWVWHNWALQKDKQGLTEEAIRLLEKVRGQRRVPDVNRYAYRNSILDLSNLYLRANRVSEADETLETHHQVLSNDPFYCLYRQHARVLVRYTNDYDRAIRYSVKANNGGCSANLILSEARFHQWAAMGNQASQSSLLQAKATTPNLARVYYALSSYSAGVGVLNRLDQKGVSLDAEAPDGMNALIYAVYDRNFDAAAALIGNGANPNGFAINGNLSPLFVAISRDDEQFVRFLLENGADPFLKNSSGESAIDLANRLGNQRLSNLLSAKST
ncbi:ankyrin repeat domain-containing protein [Marinobacter sp. CHS3-4]|uniref:ankyrin repeat domain-containing protein n=1 Tax=Marinobacter sp. CHS3-4 TaxID=3045174 RepID=UPI0024B5D442|nr:ankyrin repeat domain-containing protein [Marinobacter sp. CHS3-4]MDI9244229.1 ankyrin repeat domain-containing protein [Marinobacter sp. CHS3-4]